MNSNPNHTDGPSVPIEAHDGQIWTGTCPHGVPRHGYFVIREMTPDEVAVYCPCCGRPGIRNVDDAASMPCPTCGVEAELDNRAARS